MPNDFPQKSKIYGQMSRAEFYPCAWYRVLSVPFSRGHDFVNFFPFCVEKTDTEKQSYFM